MPPPLCRHALRIEIAFAQISKLRLCRVPKFHVAARIESVKSDIKKGAPLLSGLAIRASLIGENHMFCNIGRPRKESEHEKMHHARILEGPGPS